MKNTVVKILSAAFFWTAFHAGASCLDEAPRMFFLQPSNEMAGQASLLSKVLRDELGHSKPLVLQWSRHGSNDYWPKSGAGWLQGALQDAAPLYLIHGLYLDDRYDAALRGSDQKLSLLLQNSRQQSVKQAKHLLQAMPNGLRAWYLPEEIDDLNWQTPQRQKLLVEHLLALRQSLGAVKKGLPIHMSAYFGGHGSAQVFAAFLRTVHEQTGIVWILQDGQGVIRSPAPDTLHYLRVIHETLPAQAWIGLIEAFDERQVQGQTQYCPASANELRARQAVWCLATGRAAQAVFSLSQLHPEILGAGANRCVQAR